MLEGVQLNQNGRGYKAVVNVPGKRYYLYSGKDYFEACCARMSGENRKEKGLPIKPEKIAPSHTQKELVYLHVKNNSGCSRDEITIALALSKGHVNNYLADLKSKERIETLDRERGV